MNLFKKLDWYIYALCIFLLAMELFTTSQPRFKRAATHFAEWYDHTISLDQGLPDEVGLQ